LKYEAEPGFFFGAMFVSYALSIVLVGMIWAVMTMLDFSFDTVIWTILPALIIAVPLLFKISRSIWMNLFMHYNSEI